MYLFEEMIDSGLSEGEEWTSPDHRQVAVYACINNARVDCMDTLCGNVSIINDATQEEIRTITDGEHSCIGHLIVMGALEGVRGWGGE